MRSFAKKFNHREWTMIKSLQKHKHVPYLFGKDKTHMFMERYETNLFDAVARQNYTIDASFCSTLFRFLERLHREEGVYHGDIKPEHICLNKDSWAIIDWESARPHGVRAPAHGGIYTGARADVYAATMTIVAAHTGRNPENLHCEVHGLMDGILCPAYMLAKNWESILPGLYNNESKRK